MHKRVISFLCALVMLLGMIPCTTDARAVEATAVPVVTVEKSWITVGQEVEVDVSIANNPGIIGGIFTIFWSEGLELVSAKNKEAFEELNYQKPSNFNPNGTNFMWYGDSISEALDGVFLTLTFTVLDETVIDRLLAINVTARDVLDSDKNTVSVQCISGGLQVIDYMPGDVTDDGVIDMFDITDLAQYISDNCTTDPNGFNVSVNNNASNVDDNDVIDMLDLILICQYISDDCETRVDGFNVTLLPVTPKCAHVMESIAYKAATCTEAGNLSYCYCTLCEKYFNNEAGSLELTHDQTVIPATGHTEEFVPGSPAGPGVEGTTDGSKCSACGEWLIPQEPIPPLALQEYRIEYVIDGSDTYLTGLLRNGSIDNSQNPDRYSTQEGVKEPLKPVTVAGYEFEGWFDAAVGGNKVSTIPVGTTGDLILYARWKKTEYTITFDSPDYEKASITYTVDTGAALGQDPYIPGYTFIGWSNNDGFIVSSTIPVGTTGNIMLHANWTSNRNKAVSYGTYADPIIVLDEEDQKIVFVYDIGRVENVPLKQISETINLIPGNTYVVNEKYTYTDEISTTDASEVANSIANTTTRSSGWTLSKEWNDFYSAEEGAQLGQIMSEERVDSTGTVVGGKYFVSNSEGGSSYLSTESGGSSSTSAKVTTDTSKGINYSYDTETEKYVDAKLSVENETEVSAKVSASYGVAKAEAGVKNTTTVGAETSSGRKDTDSTHFDGSESTYVGTVNTSDSSSYFNVTSNSSSSWNSTKGYENSETYSKDTEISKAVSEQIMKTTNYSVGNSMGETNTSDVRVEGTDVNETAYTTKFQYYKGTTTEKEVSKSETLTTPGNYRYVLAGTVHVFGVVGYDIPTGSYYTYTYSVLSDKTEVWRDFSRETTHFDDCENGVVEFTVPYEVNEYVLSMTASSHGIEFDKGVVNGIELTDKYDNNIVIPQYHSEKDSVSGDYSSYRTVSFNASFLQDTVNDSEETKAMKAHIRSTVETIVLPPSITEIPAEAFKGCTALRHVIAFGITSIGDNAFEGCVNLGVKSDGTVGEFCVDSLVTYVGKDAFKDAPSVSAKAANAQVADAIISSGAKNIKVDMEKVADGTFDNRRLSIPDTTESFTLIGHRKTFRNLQVVSHAKTTALGSITFIENKDTPLDITSEKLTLSEVTIQDAPGFAMMLRAESTAMYLQGTNAFSSLSSNAVLGRNVSFAKADAGITGRLQLTGNYAIYGSKINSGMVVFNEGTWVELDEDGYNAYLKTIILTFDPNGGSLADDQTIKTVYYGQNYGEMPVPTLKYHTFVGWFTQVEGGTQVKSEDIIETLAPQTLFAHWIRNEFVLLFDANGGSVNEKSRVVTCGMAIGTLPVPERAGYSFEGWFHSDGTRITAETAMEAEGNVTITAKWKLISYTVSWNTGTGYTIIVKRTSSPNAGASTGTLSNGATVYYGDVLSISYSANTGYSLTNEGATSVTVSGNVSSSQIYATAKVNSYTVAWNTGTGYTISVKRTSSPNAGASTGTLSNGATVYYGDVLSISYGASTGYSLTANGITSITVTSNVTSSQIYANAEARSITYDVVYRSVNGTSLGSSTATYKYGTTNTITAPAKSGYITPSSVEVKWSSANREVITFTYHPSSVGYTEKSGTCVNAPTITYSATLQYQNRTATSVQVRVVWTSTIKAYGYTVYGQKFTASCGSTSTGATVAAFNTWKNSSSSDRSSTGTSGWITVPLSTTNQTSVSLSIYYYQVNSNDTDMTKHYGEGGLSTTWSMTIPAY